MHASYKLRACMPCTSRLVLRERGVLPMSGGARRAGQESTALGAAPLDGQLRDQRYFMLGVAHEAPRLPGLLQAQARQRV